MSRVVKKIWRYGKWPLFFVVLSMAFLQCFVPFAKWVFIDKTLEVYQEVADRYSSDEDGAVGYRGVITDTLMSPSAKVKGRQDTVVHRQSIELISQSCPSDGKPRREDVGTFGDSAGLLNAFFSFLAFMAVLMTIYLQSRKDGHDKQNGARVLFEQEFFAMVGMLENIVSHLRFEDYQNLERTMASAQIVSKLMSQIYKNTGINPPQEEQEEPELKVIEGRAVFRYLYAERENYNVLAAVGKDKDIRATMESLEYCFDGTLDHYFRYLYRILKHIDESKLLDQLDEPKKEREYYAHLLRAQLSNYELKMMFYNGLLGENPQTIKVLMEKYAMFNNLRAWELGKFQQEYYQAILDEEIIEDAKDIDLQTTYRVTAFWDEGKLREFKKRTAKKENNGWRVLTWVKSKCQRRKEVATVREGPVSAEIGVPAKVILETSEKKKAEKKQVEKQKQAAKKQKGRGKRGKSSKKRKH